MSAFWNWLIGREQAVVTAVKAEVTAVETKAVAVVEATFEQLVSAVEAKITEFEAFAQKRIADALEWAEQATHFNDISVLAATEAKKASTVAASLKALFNTTAPVAPAVVDVTPVAPAITNTPAPLQAGQPLA